MNKVLIPIDFSDTSLNALSYAIELFGKSSLEITILHVYGTKSTALMMKSIDDIIVKDVEREMKGLIDKLQKEAPNVSFKGKIVKNYAVSVITSMGNSGLYDFIVMGTKGASGLKEVFVGSVAGGVISKTLAPVIVVPTNYKYRPLTEIIFAISNIPLSSKNVVKPLRKIAKMHKSRIEILHISKHQSPSVRDTIKHMEGLRYIVTYVYGSGTTNEELNGYLAENKTELLCLVRNKKGFFDSLLSDSVTLKQTFNSEVPLLILHD